MTHLIERSFARETKDEVCTRTLILGHISFDLPYYFKALVWRREKSETATVRASNEGPFAFKTRNEAQQYLEEIAGGLIDDGYEERTSALKPNKS